MNKYITASFMVLALFGNIEAQARDVERCEDNVDIFKDIYISNGSEKERVDAAFGVISLMPRNKMYKVISYTDGKCSDGSCKIDINYPDQSNRIGTIAYNDGTLRSCRKYYQEDTKYYKNIKKGTKILHIMQSYEYPMDKPQSERKLIAIEVTYKVYNNIIDKSKYPEKGEECALWATRVKVRSYNGVMNTKLDLTESVPWKWERKEGEGDLRVINWKSERIIQNYLRLSSEIAIFLDRTFYSSMS